MKIADLIPDGWKHWLRWLEVCGEQGAATDLKEAEMLRVDGGRNLGLTRVLARKKSLNGKRDWLDLVPGG